MKPTLPSSNGATYSWYAVSDRKEIVIGPSGFDCGDYRELGELGTEPDILAYWAANSFPVQLLEEGRAVRAYFKLEGYSILYPKP